MDFLTSNKQIVITSIFSPTEAVKLFAEKEDYQLIVVGDKKTPDNWQLQNVSYLSPQWQESSEYNLIKMLPYNHYCRKMIGYIYAIQQGAEIIIDTDDDNLPYPDWDFPNFKGVQLVSSENKGFVNIYKNYSEKHIWPRGFPLKKIKEESSVLSENDLCKKDVTIGIWQGLADEDPDVDAIYRLTDNTPCYFNKNTPIVLSKGTYCPFNSQNTAFRKELFPLLYLPSFVTFRFTDILRGLIAQPIMHLYDYHLGFTNATVKQERNEHDYLKDFESEIPVFLYSEKIIELVNSVIKKNVSISENLINAYKCLLKENIVHEKEIFLLEAWLNDLRRIA